MPIDTLSGLLKMKRKNMPAKPGKPLTTDKVRLDLETVLASLRQHQLEHPTDPGCSQWSGVDVFDEPVTQPPRNLIDSRGSLGVVSRLILIRYKLDLTAKTIAASYEEECARLKLPPDKKSAFKLAFSLNAKSTKPRNLPDIKTLTATMSSLLNQWREKSPPEGPGLDPHPEPGVLFSLPFTGKHACDEYLRYLAYNEPTSAQLSSNRTFFSGGQRATLIKTLVDDCVNGDAMLINVHATEQWDGLRALAETLAKDIDRKESERCSGKRSQDGSRRAVLFVPLRANALPLVSNKRYQSSALRDEHMGLDQLMGILRSFTRHGAEADVCNATPMEDEVGFANTLHEIRESLLKTPRFFIFDGVHDPKAPTCRKTVQRVLADDHFFFVLKRLLEPLITATDEPRSLEVFYQNRFIITSNNKALTDTIWTASLDKGGKDLRQPPLTRRLPELEDTHYEQMLESSIEHNVSIKELLRIEALRAVRSDVVNQCLNATISLFSNLPAELDQSGRSSAIVLRQLVTAINDAEDGVSLVVRVLMTGLHKKSKGRSKAETGQDRDNTPRLWAELLLLLSLSPEGLTLETIQRCLVRLSMVPDNTPIVCPALHQAYKSGTLSSEIECFAKHARSILGFIRREFVEGPEVDDHPLEFWEGLSPVHLNTSGMTLDFRYPEVRQSLLEPAIWSLWEVDRYLLHRVLSEIALQYQTMYLRHTDYHHRGSVRNWRRLFTCLYHGLASIGHPDRNEHRDYGIRNVDSKGSSLDYWLFLYAKLYRQVLEGPGLWRISRVMGLDDLKIALLELFSKPWLLDPEFSVDSPVKPRFIEHFNNTAQPAAEYYLTRIRADLGRGEFDRAKTGWYERFKGIPAEDIQPIDRLRMEYALLDRALQTVESITTEHVIGILQDITRTGVEFKELEQLVHGSGNINGLVRDWPSVVNESHHALPGLIALVDQEKVSQLILSMVDRVHGNTSLIGMALNCFGTLSRFESDRVDFSEGFRDAKEFPPGLQDEVISSLKQVMLTKSEEFMQYRKLALARLVVVEAARIELFRVDPTGAGFVRSNAQARTAVRLAIKLDDKYRRQQPRDLSGPSPYFRFARRLADSSVRMGWQFPREQANALVLETSMLRAESERLIGLGTNSLSHTEAALARRLLLSARATIGRAERVMTTPNLASRARLRMTLERYKLSCEMARYYRVRNDEAAAGIYRQHAVYDLGVLRGAAYNNDTRPYWKLLVGFQKKHSIE